MRWTQPGWGPDNPDWIFGNISKKMQKRDRKPRPKIDKFTKGMKNNRYNLLKKVDELRLKEELEL